MAYSWFILLLIIAGTAFFLFAAARHIVWQGLFTNEFPDGPAPPICGFPQFFLTFAGCAPVVYAVPGMTFRHFISSSAGTAHSIIWFSDPHSSSSSATDGWLISVPAKDESSILLSRLMSILYGVGAALTLDEFALWLNLRDVYWSAEGRSSIDAIVLFGAFLAAGAWGAPLFQSRPGKKSD